MDNPIILILPTFYPYPYQDGETPLDVMSRWAKEASSQDLDASEEGIIVEASGQPSASTKGHMIQMD